MNVRAAIASHPRANARPASVDTHVSPPVSPPQIAPHIAPPAPGPGALPSPAQFASLCEVIKTVFAVPAVTIALNGAPTNAETGVYRAFLEIPLISGDEVIGSLRVLDTDNRAFTDRDCVLLEGFARLVVEQVGLWAEASRDMLTNAMTRRVFYDVLHKSFAARQRTGGRATLVIFDLDHFKAINDTWGHSAGDAVLRTVSRVVQRELRTEDSFGRLGGEEFGILLANADGAAAVDVTERIRAAVAAAIVPGHPDIRVTASFGVAELSDTMLNDEDWAAAADNQLYRAKDAGRNRVCLATKPLRAPLLN
ncbi:MAG: sensor domain-containing diguanylate cyclase [Pararhodobacter sp.]